jgi:Tudor domain
LVLDVSKPSVLNAKIGTPCVAQYIEDNSWYRGKILAIDGQEAEVLFVDYGNKQKSQLGDLKAIEKTFLTLPPQAYHCCLTAIKVQGEWTPEDKTKFEDESMSKHVTATFTQRTSDGKYRVRLTHSDDDGGNVQVLNELYGAPSTINVPQPKDGCVPFELPSTNVNVAVAWFYHSCKLYLALSNTNDYQVRQPCESSFCSNVI